MTRTQHSIEIDGKVKHLFRINFANGQSVTTYAATKPQAVAQYAEQIAAGERGLDWGWGAVKSIKKI